MFDRISTHIKVPIIPVTKIGEEDKESYWKEISLIDKTENGEVLIDEDTFKKAYLILK